MARSRCSGARQCMMWWLKNERPDVRLPARQWGERVRTNFPGGAAALKRARRQSRNHGIRAYIAREKTNARAIHKLFLEWLQCDHRSPYETEAILRGAAELRGRTARRPAGSPQEYI